MARESFSNSAVAAQLNANFVSIKLDREERPEVDRIYMSYVQAVSGHGGWPLSVWLTPELKPFFGGTYFPPEEKAGRPGFRTVLDSIARGWAEDREKVVAESERVVRSLISHHEEAPLGDALPDFTEPAGEAYEQCYTYLFENFDAASGGFGGAPKFPRPANLTFLTRCAVIQGLDSASGQEAMNMVVKTLMGMSMGGIHDHVGGGFHRYAVDEGWGVPHFEKMLYDQAQIAVNLLDALVVSGDERLGWTARGIFEYVLERLRHGAGGFFAAEDADSVRATSEGETLRQEGAFYVWSVDELNMLWGGDAEWIADLYGVEVSGNVPGQRDHQQELRGFNVLKQQKSLGEVAEKLSRSPSEVAESLSRNLVKLKTQRERRPRPLRDEKTVSAWNGLMIGALARASCVDAIAWVDQCNRYREAAVAAAAFVKSEMWDQATQTLVRCWRDGRQSPVGFAEDYAAMISGLLDLYEATFDSAWLRWADELQISLNVHFWDDAGGGYFQANAADKSVVLRLKDDQDGAEPSANSLAASNLFRLGAMLRDESYRERGLRVVQALRPVWSKTPWALPALLSAMEWALGSPYQIVLSGDVRKPRWEELAQVARNAGTKRRVVIAVADIDGDDWLVQRVPELVGVVGRGREPSAQVCRGFQCETPVSTAAELVGLLD